MMVEFVGDAGFRLYEAENVVFSTRHREMGPRGELRTLPRTEAKVEFTWSASRGDAELVDLVTGCRIIVAGVLALSDFQYTELDISGNRVVIRGTCA